MARRPVDSPYNTCSLASCDSRHEAKGYCNKHYLRFKKYGSPEAINYHKTHGQTETPTYKSWEAMKRRCLNTNQPAYAKYGGRGITVCTKWLKFENFLKDMGERPKGMTLDRINNDGNYEPANCRWASAETQARNKGVRKNNHTGITGIYRRETGKFVVQIRHANEQLYLGQYSTLAEAKTVRELAEMEYGYV